MSEARVRQSGATYPLFGKYRGKVIDNIDPLFQGRIIAEVAAISGSMMNWAMPCVPYAGPQVGFYAIPPIGANVWIEFEAGDPNFPIWTGCFWGIGEVPLGPEGLPLPEVKIFKTEFVTLFLNDLPEIGGFQLKCMPLAVATPLSMTFNSAGIEINAAPAIVKMIPEEGITLEYPEATISMTAASIEIAVPESSTTLTPAATEILAGDVSVTATAAIELSAAANVSIEAGAATEISAGANVSIEAGAAAELSAGANVAIEAGAACEITTGANLSLAAGLAIEAEATAAVAITAATAEITAGGIALTGAVEVTGVLLIDGQPPMIL